PTGARFVPGTLLAGRWRLVAPLGRGGMGEVYRADDLKLGEPVALKFLPPALAGDAAALARLHREVRIARRVAHPNVCRVFDVGEAEGQTFITMELIDGEDLAGLLRRIGRIPADKALEVARQLCAGLAAAHDEGVLHRDLKPANVMIDGRGRAKVTDFGLAGLAHRFGRGDAGEGTPAYMAPEQLAGREVTVQSDLYALGLVLYELTTGRRPFAAATRAELARAQSETSPPGPASLADGVDALTERAILRCLAADPADRPASAREVAAMLPGGDPLAAALAAGETPSPEMVAAAPRRGSLARPVAAGLLAAVLALVALLFWLNPRVGSHGRLPAGHPPEELAFLARRWAGELGAGGGVEAAGWEQRTGILLALAEAGAGDGLWRRVESGAVPIEGFWYRSAPRPWQPRSPLVREEDPPLGQPGEVLFRLDPDMRLRSFVAEPPVDPPPGEAPDWGPWLARAGLDPTAVRAVAPRWRPPVYADRRAAFEAVPAGGGDPLRVEAASYGGRPVWFEVVEPGARPHHAVPPVESASETAFWWLLGLFYLIVAVLAAVLARRNLRAGRGDRRGALRIAGFVLAIEGIAWLIAAPHAAGPIELLLLMEAAAEAVLLAALVYLAYLALEPFVRRRWPQRLVSWSRLLAGDLSDPMVGRDVLVGVLLGLAMAALNLGRVWATAEEAGYGLPLHPMPPIVLEGWRGLIVWLETTLLSGLIVSIASLVFLVLLFAVLRRRWAAAVVFGLLFAGVVALTRPTPLGLLTSLVVAAVWTLALVRGGLLTAVVTHLCFFLGFYYPWTLDPGAWYLRATLVAAGAAVALALYGALTAIGGRAALAGWLPEEG
ncbi:MAG TPA: serine/threonine-protein kinase, partial [Thermoanaerobaculia bacterium]